MTLRCRIFGHKFFHKDFTGATYWPGYCLRCGVRAGGGT